jgi:hypothetical protein
MLSGLGWRERVWNQEVSVEVHVALDDALRVHVAKMSGFDAQPTPGMSVGGAVLEES